MKTYKLKITGIFPTKNTIEVIHDGKTYYLKGHTLNNVRRYSIGQVIEYFGNL